MRRKDREITDLNEILKIIAKCDAFRLALHDGEYPYIVPLNFGKDVQDGKIDLYFHGALQGKKIDLIRKNPHASFEMDCGHQIILYEERMSCTRGYESVMGHGVIEEVPESKKERALCILMRHFHHEDFPFSRKMMKGTAVFCLHVTEITAKKRDNFHPEERIKEYMNLEVGTDIKTGF